VVVMVVIIGQVGETQSRQMLLRRLVHLLLVVVMVVVVVVVLLLVVLLRHRHQHLHVLPLHFRMIGHGLSKNVRGRLMLRSLALRRGEDVACGCLHVSRRKRRQLLLLLRVWVATKLISRGQMVGCSRVRGLLDGWSQLHRGENVARQRTLVVVADGWRRRLHRGERRGGGDGRGRRVGAGIQGREASKVSLDLWCCVWGLWLVLWNCRGNKPHHNAHRPVARLPFLRALVLQSSSAQQAHADCGTGECFGSDGSGIVWPSSFGAGASCCGNPGWHTT